MTTTEQQGTRASDLATSAADDARAIAQDAKGEVSAVAEEAKAKARDLAGDARTKLRAQADEQATRAAGAMRELSSQLATMAAAAPDGGLAPELVHEASAKLDDFARRFDGGGLDSMVEDVKRFARNKPGTFLLGALAAGVIAGRLTRGADTAALVDAAKPTPDDDGSPGSLDLRSSDEPPMLDPVGNPSTLDPVGGQSTPTAAPTPAFEPAPSPDRPLPTTEF